MSSPAITGFIGGTPGAVALRLVVISFLVGMALVMFGFEPEDIYFSLMRLFRRLIDLGLNDFRQIGHILLTGAMIVLPLWLLMRLMDGRRAR